MFYTSNRVITSPEHLSSSQSVTHESKVVVVVPCRGASSCCTLAFAKNTNTSVTQYVRLYTHTYMRVYTELVNTSRHSRYWRTRNEKPCAGCRLQAFVFARDDLMDTGCVLDLVISLYVIQYLLAQVITIAL